MTRLAFSPKTRLAVTVNLRQVQYLQLSKKRSEEGKPLNILRFYIQTQTAFECYNPNWRNDPDFQGTSQRQPVLLPNRNAPSPDPNPSEPNSEQLGGEKRKREWSSQLFYNKEINTGATVDMSGMDDMFYAAKYQSPYLHPGGRDRLESTCSDEYLESKDVPSNRYYRPPVHSEDQPFTPRIAPPKPPDRRLNINKPKPNSD